MEEQCATIQLVNGGEALVDSSMFEQLSAYRWHRKKCRRGIFYAVRYEYGGGPHRKTVLMHRQVTGYPAGVVDHANRNGLDNRRCNLRPCSVAQNSQNRTVSRTSRSRFKGVHWQVTERRWTARIAANGVKHNLGCFKSLFDARSAYAAAAREMHGEFACVDGGISVEEFFELMTQF